MILLNDYYGFSLQSIRQLNHDIILFIVYFYINLLLHLIFLLSHHKMLWIIELGYLLISVN